MKNVILGEVLLKMEKKINALYKVIEKYMTL